MTDGKDYCGGCGQKLVEGTFATLPDGKMFHADCFRCQHCQQSIQDRFISGPETKFYHSECYDLMLNVRCVKCQQLITGKDESFVLSVASGDSTKGGEKIHAKCFCCERCNRPLDGQVHRKDGRYYDTECYTDLFSDRCNQCQLALGFNCNYLLFEDKKYHPECFRCSECNESLAGRKFAVRNSFTKSAGTADETTGTAANNNSNAMICDGCIKLVKRREKQSGDNLAKSASSLTLTKSMPGLLNANAPNNNGPSSPQELKNINQTVPVTINSLNANISPIEPTISDNNYISDSNGTMRKSSITPALPLPPPPDNLSDSNGASRKFSINLKSLGALPPPPLSRKPSMTPESLPPPPALNGTRKPSISLPTPIINSGGSGKSSITPVEAAAASPPASLPASTIKTTQQFIVPTDSHPPLPVQSKSPISSSAPSQQQNYPPTTITAVATAHPHPQIATAPETVKDADPTFDTTNELLQKLRDQLNSVGLDNGMAPTKTFVNQTAVKIKGMAIATPKIIQKRHQSADELRGKANSNSDSTLAISTAATQAEPSHHPQLQPTEQAAGSNNVSPTQSPVSKSGLLNEFPPPPDRPAPTSVPQVLQQQNPNGSINNDSMIVATATIQLPPTQQPIKQPTIPFTATRKPAVPISSVPPSVPWKTASTDIMANKFSSIKPPALPPATVAVKITTAPLSTSAANPPPPPPPPPPAPIAQFSIVKTKSTSQENLKDGIPQSLLADIRSTSMSSLKKIGSVEGGLPNCASVSRSGSSSSFTGAAGGSGSRSRPDPVAELKTVLALKRQAMGVSRSGPLSADDEDWK